MNGEHNDNISKLDAVPDTDIQRSGVTITQFMHNRGIEGGVALDQPGASSSGASAMLVSQDGRKYDVGKVVATGGMGAILSAKDLNIRRTVAMKVLLEPDKAADDQILRFIEEAQITGQMEHPSIVPVHELGVDASGNVFYTMKFVKGVTLDDILFGIREADAETIAKYPLNSLLNIFLKVCDAIAFAHSKGVVHRDLKPENIMVGEFGEVLVMDWGLGKVLRLDCKSDQSDQSDSSDKLPSSFIDSLRSVSAAASGAMTMEGAVMGTPLYMSPEQAYGKVSEIDQRTDIYALGAILYSILTLNPPVEGETVNAILIKVANGEIEAPTKYERSHKSSLPHLPGGHVPPALSHVAMKAMSLEQKDRYQSVKDLQKEIEAYQGGFATKAERAGWLRKGILLAKRHKAISISSSVIFLVLLVFGSYAGWEWYRQWGKWIKVCDFDFTKSRTLPDDIVFMDKYIKESVPAWKQDEAGLKMAQYQWLWLKETVGRGNVRIVADIVCDESPDALELCLNSQIQRTKAWYSAPLGYSGQFGGYQGTVDSISRNDGELNSVDLGNSVKSSLILGRRYRVIFERIEDELLLFVDGIQKVRIIDPLPFSGEGFDRVGLRSFSSGMHLLSLSVQRMALPEKASPLVAGDCLYQLGLYDKASEQYLQIARDFPGTSIAERGLAKAYFALSSVKDLKPEHIKSM